MEQIIDCFVPLGEHEATARNVQTLGQEPLVKRVFTVGNGTAQPGVTNLQGSMTASATMKLIAQTATAPWTLLYLKPVFIQPGYRALERMVKLAAVTEAPLTYSDHYFISADGKRTDAPLIDCQQGALRDDFDFGSLVLLRTDALKEAAGRITAGYQAAGFYDLRLKLQQRHPFCHIPEPLYSNVQLDTRKTGERLFDYVDPRNRASQIEMEQAVTDHLKQIGAYLEPGHYREVDLEAGTFPCEMSVMIPVRNRLRTIRDAIDSALSQETSFSYNVFVVENGPECRSTDGTTEAVDSYDDDRLIHIVTTRRDLGVGGSWNMAAHDPRCGRFIVQLDSDDVYPDGHTLEKIHTAFLQQHAAMIIGSYSLTDINRKPLPPGLIDHREWTEANGRNNALRINGLGAPRAFFTPVIRSIDMPNVNYGEDYALGLALSRHYRIGRIMESIYLCRRWDDNSDGNLSRERENRNNLYKDRIRTWEVMARIREMKSEE